MGHPPEVLLIAQLGSLQPRKVHGATLAFGRQGPRHSTETMATEWGNMGDNMGDMEVSNP